VGYLSDGRGWQYRWVTVEAAEHLTNAIRWGYVADVRALLAAEPELATARVQGGRSALHVATDWPGYFPNGPAIVHILIQAGADPNARTEGKVKGETPLHWAASTDDVDVADILIRGGADVDAADGSIGTPLENAIGYGCWHVARHLADAGATINKLWHAAALGHLTRLDLLLATEPTPGADDVNEAFWQACHGGQFRAAQRLLEFGPDLNYHPGYAENRPIEIAAEVDTRRQQLVEWLQAHGAQPTP
jgi:ankyrin repeat protein